MTQTYSDNNIEATNGFAALITAIALVIASLFFCFLGFTVSPISFTFAVVLIIVAVFIFKGVTTISPNEVVVLQFFGKYSGTVINNGLVFINPLMSQEFISTKIDNFSNKPIKVNDKRGNPLELSCMFAWRVSDAAKAMFSVEDYDEFIKNQVEGILAQIASLHPYDSEESNEISFRKNISDISQNLKEMLQKRVQECGLEIVDVRFNHFAYAVEIAASMLKKQQAEAMIDARRKIVEGAQKMVEELIKEMDKGEVQFSNEDKVRLATNLMTVLVSENGTQPVVRV